MDIHLFIVCGCFHAATAKSSGGTETMCLQILNYLLSDLSQKMVADLAGGRHVLRTHSVYRVVLFLAWVAKSVVFF